MDKFCEGILFAASLVVSLHDRPTVAASVLRECGLENADCSDMDKGDRDVLKVLNKEKGIKLKGV